MALVVVGSLTAFKVGGQRARDQLDTTLSTATSASCALARASMLISVLLHPALAVVVASF